MEIPRKSKVRRGVAGIVAGLIIFVALFTVGTGYFLYQITLNRQYDVAKVNSQLAFQAIVKEQLNLITSASGSNLLVSVINTGGVPVVIVGIFVEDQTNALLCTSPKTAGTSTPNCPNYSTVSIPIDIGVQSQINTGQAVTCSFSTPSCTIGLITKRGNVFTQAYPIPPAPFATGSGSSGSAPIGFIQLDFNHFYYYTFPIGCGTLPTGNPSGLPPAAGCQLSPWPNTNAFSGYSVLRADESKSLAFGVNITNLDPLKRTITISASSILFQILPPTTAGSNIRAFPFVLGFCCDATGKTLAQSAPYQITLQPGIPKFVYFFVGNVGSPTGNQVPNIVANFLFLTGSLSTAGGSCTAPPCAYGQNLAFVTSFYN